MPLTRLTPRMALEVAQGLRHFPVRAKGLFPSKAEHTGVESLQEACCEHVVCPDLVMVMAFAYAIFPHQMSHARSTGDLWGAVNALSYSLCPVPEHRPGSSKQVSRAPPPPTQVPNFAPPPHSTPSCSSPFVLKFLPASKYAGPCTASCICRRLCRDRAGAAKGPGLHAESLCLATGPQRCCQLGCLLPRSVIPLCCTHLQHSAVQQWKRPRISVCPSADCCFCCRVLDDTLSHECRTTSPAQFTTPCLSRRSGPDGSVWRSYQR